jgi:hypothetical protein
VLGWDECRGGLAPSAAPIWESPLFIALFSFEFFMILSKPNKHHVWKQAGNSTFLIYLPSDFPGVREIRERSGPIDHGDRGLH